MKCIVCQSEDLFVNFTHTYWKKPVHTCKNCDHTHLYDYDNVDEKDYSVNKHRAGKYLKMLENVPVESVLEIGPATNFWFSKQFCEHLNVSYSIFDVVDIIPPEPIKKIDKLEGEFDLVLGIHVLEHVPDPYEFVNTVDKMSKYFIIEVPNCDPQAHKVRTTNQGHYHAFSEQSFNLTFEHIDCKVIMRASGVHSGGLPFVAYRLPEGYDIQ